MRFSGWSMVPRSVSRLRKDLVYAKNRPKCSEWHRGLNSHRMLKNAAASEEARPTGRYVEPLRKA